MPGENFGPSSNPSESPPVRTTQRLFTEPSSWARCGRGAGAVVAILFAAVAFLWTMGPLLIPPLATLDSSWQVGLDMATTRGLLFGKEIVFSFGPLGFLCYPVYVSFLLWALSFSFSLLAHFLWLFCVWLFLRESFASWKEYVLIAVSLIFASTMTDLESKVMTSIIILTYLSVTDLMPQGRRPYALMGSFALGAIMSLVRFTFLPMFAPVLLCACVLLALKKRFALLACGLLAYGVSTSLLWFGSGQGLNNVSDYFWRSMEIANGYAAAMADSGKILHIFLALLIFLSFLSVFARAAFSGKAPALVLISLASGFIFISFRHGFVRHDAPHACSFFAGMVILLSLLYVGCKSQLSGPVRILILLLLVTSMGAMYERYHMDLLAPHFRDKVSVLGSSLTLLTDPQTRDGFVLASKKHLRHDYGLSQQTVGMLGNCSVDILPWDISLAYAYDLRWTPRPVFQSYSAYTKELDLLNAAHFRGGRGPDALLYLFASIDSRYPLFDEPATFAEILCDYHAEARDGGFVVLKKNYRTSCGPAEEISSVLAEIGKPIKVPRYAHHYVFARIHMSYTSLGKVLNFIYKPAEVYVTLRGNGSPSEKFRFIPDGARNGVFVSDYVADTDAFERLLCGKSPATEQVEEIVLEVDNPRHYRPNVTVEFFAMARTDGLPIGKPLYPPATSPQLTPPETINSIQSPLLR